METNSVFVFGLGAICLSGCGPPARREENVNRVPKVEVFVLPTGYRGPFMALYSQPAGYEPVRRGDTAFYQVPVTGIVRIAHDPPPRSTSTFHVFENAPAKMLRSYPTCADMRVHLSGSEATFCWLDYWVGGTGVPYHIAGVVSDWGTLPANFERTSFVYDSVLHKGGGRHVRKWSEPAEVVKRNRSTKRTE